MQKKSGKQIAKYIMPIIIMAVLFLQYKFDAISYYLFGLVITVCAIYVFVASFESRRPGAKEIVTIATMSALAAASRVAFIMLPAFKPMAAVIMITGMAFGASAGFLTGAVAALISNFAFGQGPWTTWQMLAFGLCGVIGAWFYRIGIFNENRRLITALAGGLVIVLIIGPVLDTSTFFMAGSLMENVTLAIYVSGFPLNVVHGIATAVTLFLLCAPVLETLTRIKKKYGVMNEV